MKTSRLRELRSSLKRALSFRSFSKKKITKTPLSPSSPGAQQVDKIIQVDPISFLSPESLGVTPEIISPASHSATYSTPQKPFATELEYNTPYYIAFRANHSLITYDKTSTNSRMIYLTEELGTTNQQWMLTEEGYIESCHEPNVVLEVREGILSCGRRTCTPLETVNGRDDEVVSQHFDLVHSTNAETSIEKIIQLRRNKKMILGMSNKVESKLVLHPLVNAGDLWKSSWLFRPV